MALFLIHCQFIGSIVKACGKYGRYGNYGNYGRNGNISVFPILPIPPVLPIIPIGGVPDRMGMTVKKKVVVELI